MKGDFSRDTFDPLHRFSRVLQQQGRVQLDADWNEQTSILLHHLRTLSRDLIGPHGGESKAFEITVAPGEEAFDFTIGAGNYYVDGVLCENREDPAHPAPLKYKAQLGSLPAAQLNHGPYLVYLDVWERLVTHIQEPAIREPALGALDTAARAQVVWQVRLLPTGANPPQFSDYKAFIDFLKVHGVQARGTGALKASVDRRYRGLDNQLYRVEIHRPGPAWDGAQNTKGTGATFKWARDNGSATFGVAASSVEPGAVRVTLMRAGPDNRIDLTNGNWVELLDDHTVMRGQPGPLLRVADVNREDLTVTLEKREEQTVTVHDNAHPVLRRWDHRSGHPSESSLGDDGAIMVQVNPGGPDRLINLEEGIAIAFSPDAMARYQTGDYWLIPARAATAGIVWPRTEQPDGTMASTSMPAAGETHYYAPLAVISFDANGHGTLSIASLRKTLQQLAT